MRLLSPGLIAATLFTGACVLRPSTAPLTDIRREVVGRLPEFDRIIADAETFRVQLLVSTVEMGPDGRVRLRRAGFRVGAEYFYPASAIKLTAAVAALQVAEELGVSVDDPITIAPLFAGDAIQDRDPTNLAGGTITVAHEVRKLALVSDNQAFNRLFDLVGADAIHERMSELGLKSVRVNHRLSDPRPLPNPRASAGVTIRTASGRIVTVPPRGSARLRKNQGAGTRIGEGFLTAGHVRPGPVDFAERNGISLMDLQNLLVGVVRPDIEGAPRIRLTPASRSLLVDAMTIYPRESTNPAYRVAEYPDDYVKFLLPGIRRVFPATGAGERIAVVGKSGQAYGFTVENAYVADPSSGRAVFVAAVIYTNADGILNDDQYEYATVGQPFMANLGELIARTVLAHVPE